MKTIFLAFVFVFASPLFAVDSYETLQVGNDVYHRVVVLSANESSLSIRHARGIAQVPLAKLSAALQVKYGYDSARASEREAQLAEQRRQQVVEQQQRIVAAKKTTQSKAASSASSSNGGFSKFGTKPTIQAEVDLRQRFRSHGIRIRSQKGPSCSVHAILAALEYQYAEGHDRVLNLSEPYLVNATSRSLGRPDAVGFDEKTGRANGWDAGFALEHVFQAIRGHGLAYEQTREEREAKKPYARLESVAFSPFAVPGIRTPRGIENMIHVLNADMPLVVGVYWPAYSRIAHTSVLGKQPVSPNGGHAVAIIGYQCEDGNIENAKFIFRNSWGDDWGAGGYGFFTYEYLMKNLTSCYVVELR